MSKKRVSQSVKPSLEALNDVAKGGVGALASEELKEGFGKDFLSTFLGVFAVEFAKATTGLVGKALIGTLFVYLDRTGEVSTGYRLSE